MYYRAIFALISMVCLLLLSFGILPACLYETTSQGKTGDPEIRGPYSVGVKNFLFKDKSRVELWGGMSRTFYATVWYPAIENTGRPNTIGEMMGDLPGWTESIFQKVYGDELPDLIDYQTSAMIDGELASEGTPFPVILFSHGHMAIRFQNFTLCEHLASHGFIVIAPDHYGNAVLTNTDHFPVVFSPVSTATSALHRPFDVDFVFSELLKFQADEKHFLYQSMDLENFGVAGHSYGGITSLLSGDLFDYVKAIAPMNPIFIKHLPETFKKPYLLIQGEKDNIAGKYFNSNPKILEDFLKVASRPKYRIAFKNGGHYSATDACTLFPKSYREDNADCSGERIDPELANHITSSYITAFFKMALTSEQEFEEYLQTNHFNEDIGYEIFNE